MRKPLICAIALAWLAVASAAHAQLPIQLDTTPQIANPTDDTVVAVQQPSGPLSNLRLDALKAYIETGASTTVAIGSGVTGLGTGVATALQATPNTGAGVLTGSGAASYLGLGSAAYQPTSAFDPASAAANAQAAAISAAEAFSGNAANLTSGTVPAARINGVYAGLTLSSGQVTTALGYTPPTSSAVCLQGGACTLGGTLQTTNGQIVAASATGSSNLYLDAFGTAANGDNIYFFDNGQGTLKWQVSKDQNNNFYVYDAARAAFAFYVSNTNGATSLGESGAATGVYGSTITVNGPVQALEMGGSIFGTSNAFAWSLYGGGNGNGGYISLYGSTSAAPNQVTIGNAEGLVALGASGVFNFSATPTSGGVALATVGGALGTPSQLNLANATGLTSAEVTTALGYTPPTPAAVCLISGNCALGSVTASSLTAGSANFATVPTVGGAAMTVEVNGVFCPVLGPNCTVSSSSTALVANSTAITGGTSGYILYDNGTLGELATTGTGSAVLAASPHLTGTPTAPTPATSTNTTQIATAAYVQANLAGVLSASQYNAGTMATGIVVGYGFTNNDGPSIYMAGSANTSLGSGGTLFFYTPSNGPSTTMDATGLWSFPLRPVFDGATPWDSANLASPLTTTAAAATYATPAYVNAQIAAATGSGPGFSRTTTTASAGQTSFSVSYAAGSATVLVYLNGVLLPPSAYTATSGTSIVLAQGATAGAVFDAVVL